MIAPIESNMKNPVPMNTIGIEIIQGRISRQVRIPVGFSL